MSASNLYFLADSASSKGLLSLGFIDLLIIVVYFAMVLLIGFYLKRFASTGEDFFMAGRKMTAWIAGLSFISANLSSLETMGWSAMAYQYGMLGAHAYLIGAIPAILFLAVVMMPFYYICKTHSVPGYLKLRYGEASRSLAGISFAVMTVLVCGVNMFAMAKVMQLILGWNIHMSIWVSSFTVAVYVALGGLLSAVFNEVLQFFLIWLGSLLIPILGIIEAGGWSNMIDSINRQHPGQDFTSLWGNLASPADNPMGMHWTGMVFGLGLAVSFGYWCTDFLQVQRVMAAKSLRAAQNGTIIGAVLKMMVPLIVTIPGLLGLAVLSEKAGITLVPESQAAAIGGHSYNEVLPLMMARYLGPGLLGLGITCMIAGFMSGMAGNVSAFATVWTYDVYRPLFNSTASDAHYVSMGRWCSIIGVFVAIATAYAAMLFSNILVYLQVLVAWFIVPLFGVVILGMLWKRATPAAGFWGFLAGILTSVAIFFWVHGDPKGFPSLVKGDVRDAPALMSRIQGGSDPLSAHLQKSLLPATLELYKDQGTPPEKLRSVLAWELNRVIRGKSFYDSQKFAGLELSAEAAALAREEAKDLGALFRFHRLLLESAYPGAISPLTESRRFDASELNPEHVEDVTFTQLAQDMAVNMYTALWALLVSWVVSVAVSLVTKPKPVGELEGLVYGVTRIPQEGRCPWYQSPTFWAAVVAVVLVAVNIIFW